jgi:predicted ArsR family transcriptional regulator
VDETNEPGETDAFVTAVNGVSALAEPARRRLYRYAAGHPEPVSREQAAQACRVPLHSAKFHLDRLVDEGLLEVEYRRLSGRTGPGAGRPAKLYRRSGVELEVSVPDRRYRLVGDLLAQACDAAAAGARPLREALADAASSYGRQAARDATGPAGPTGRDGSLQRAASELARHGYEPRVAERAVCLVNCPFDDLARKHTDLVCGMNLALVGGVLDGLGADDLEAVLEPDPALCCVKARERDAAAPA